ncbi:MAG: Ribonuclease BN [Elusimicrobia bacterium]|nr:Ribonuclease BN [Elusimicrobiota bacterium]
MPKRSLILLLFIFCCSFVGAVEPSGIQVHVLDVGYGSAVHIKTSRNSYLIDCGPKEATSQILKHLRKLHVRHIEAVFISHLHPDHVGGLNSILEKFSVNHVYWNGRFIDQKDSLKNLQSQFHKTSFLEINHRSTFEDPNQVTFTLLPSDLLTQDPNETSMVVVVQGFGGGLLFPGDAGPLRQKELAEKNTDHLKTLTWMLWPHHGDQLDNSFLTALPNLKDVVISVGPNPYGLPAMDLEKFNRDTGIRVHRTDQQGSLQFSLHSPEIK